MADLVTKLYQKYWRFSRSVTLGAQGIVLDQDKKVLLVKHGYRSGWHLPGGGVEKNETTNSALEREIFEEAGIILKTPAKLHGIFTNFDAFPGDHIAVYIINDWEQPSIPKPNYEIIEQRFFAYPELPSEIAEGAKNRLKEVFDKAEISENWTS